MALCAATTVVAGATFASIRWLATLGVVRVYEVERMSDGARTSERALGLAGGASRALTDLDSRSWKLALAAGGFWMLRLALRSAGYRIGALRGIGFCIGFAYLVAVGAMHRTTDAIVRRDRVGRTNVCATACAASFLAGCFAMMAARNDATNAILETTERVADRAHPYDVTWAVVGNGFLCIATIGGIALATFLTVSWWTAPAERRAVALALAHAKPNA
jgi:hypothetical protein